MQTNMEFMLRSWENRWVEEWPQLQFHLASMARPSASALVDWARRMHGDVAAEALDNMIGATMITGKPS